MTGTSVTVDIFQKEHLPEEPKRNLETMIEAVASSGSKLLVFPEMFLTGYTLGREVSSLALDRDDPFLDPLIEEVKKREKYVVFGFPERSSDVRGQVHNSAMVLGPGGVEGIYRKMHLVDFGPFEEWAYFTPGTDPFMFEANGFRFGITICYDIFFPELTKHYALKGADAVICISASPSMTRNYFETVIKARSVESTVYLIYSNLVGFDSRMDFWGGSEIVGPRGNTVGKGPYFEGSVVSGNLTDSEIRIARQGRPTLRDTKDHMKQTLISWGRDR